MRVLDIPTALEQAEIACVATETVESPREQIVRIGSAVEEIIEATVEEVLYSLGKLSELERIYRSENGGYNGFTEEGEQRLTDLLRVDTVFGQIDPINRAMLVLETVRVYYPQLHGAAV